MKNKGWERGRGRGLLIERGGGLIEDLRYVQIVLSCTCKNIIGLLGEFNEAQRKISSQQVLDKRGAKTCSAAL